MRSQRHVVTVGKTPAFEAVDARALFTSIDPQQDLETWETSTTLVERWREQQSQLATRVDEAHLRYQSLLERFERSAADGDANLP